MKFLCLFAITFGFIAPTLSQQYTLTSFVAEYNDVVDGQAAVTETWDDPDFTVPLGFNFVLGGNTASSLSTSQFFLGGILVLDPDASSWDMILATTKDLVDAGYANGEFLSPITYSTTGEIGNRIFKLQWKDVALYEEVFAVENAANLFNMQLWVYETGEFEVRFGPNTIKDPSFFNNDYFSCGVVNNVDINDGSFESAHMAYGDASNPMLLYGTTEAEVFDAELIGIPENGRVYRFAPGTVSVAESTQAPFEVWPLTAAHTLNLSSTYGAVTLYELRDLSGRMIDSGQFVGQELLSVNHLSDGIYLITLRDGNRMKTFKITRKG